MQAGRSDGSQPARPSEEDDATPEVPGGPGGNVARGAELLQVAPGVLIVEVVGIVVAQLAPQRHELVGLLLQLCL